MKRFAILILVFMFSFLLSGCSVSAHFMIVNNSDGVLEIEYKWQDTLASTPYKLQFENFDGKTLINPKGTENAITKEDNESAARDKVYRISLQPKQALRIFSMRGVEKENVEKEIKKSFNIDYLKLKGNKGTIEITGKQVGFQFQNLQNDYYIIYR